MPEQEIGEVIHFFGNILVAVIKIKKDDISVGDTLHIKGHSTDFIQPVDSLQIDHKPVQTVKKGDDFGIKVKDKCREGDLVYKVTA
jgi:translation initiation factor IF-2